MQRMAGGFRSSAADRADKRQVGTIKTSGDAAACSLRLEANPTDCWMCDVEVHGVNIVL